MPFKMPWVKRYEAEINAREGCDGAREYNRKTGLLLEEFGRILTRVQEQGVFKQKDYSNQLFVLQEHQRRSVPPAAEALHASLAGIFEHARDRIRELDPSGTQSPYEVREIMSELAQSMVSNQTLFEQFQESCFSRGEA
jgi:hypothetical protein